MAEDEDGNQIIGTIRPTDIEGEMRTSYMDYAMSVIVSRALPDVRDGLKPVQRRILYSMYDQGMTPGARYQKCAAIVGEVLKQYHPHGDSSVYDTLVRLAQPWNMRYPLVQGQGNFGSQDGDSAAAYRYTEARLATPAMEILNDLEKETVDWVDNYSATTLEPGVLPASMPNLLVNGSTGIAVGMTTNVPPHNLGEICDAASALIDNPEMTTEELIGIVKGPDFPTGGIIVGSEGIKNAYGTGHGRIIVRGRHVIEDSRSGKQQIVIEEIPFQVNKASLVAKIAELVGERKLEGIHDLSDQSDRTGMRIVIELKKDVNPHTVINNLYKHTMLQTTFGAIMLALVDGRPVTLNLKSMLQHYVDYRRDVITRRTRYELAKAQDRAHLLEGYTIALGNLDKVIKIIRAAADEASAQRELEKQLKLSERQSKAIVDMRLGRLTRLEADKVRAEYQEIIEKIAFLEDILANPRKVLEMIKTDLGELKSKFGDERRTTIAWDASTDLDIESLIPTEDVVVTLTDKGYIKRVPATTYRPQKRGGKGLMGGKVREEDYVKHLVVASTKSDMLFFTDSGKVYRIRTHEVPDASRQSKGIPVVNLIDIQPRDTITSIVAIREWSDDHFLFSATRDGMIKKTPATEYRSVMRNGKIAMCAARRRQAPVGGAHQRRRRGHLRHHRRQGGALPRARGARHEPRHHGRDRPQAPRRGQGRRHGDRQPQRLPPGGQREGLRQADAARGVPHPPPRRTGRLHPPGDRQDRQPGGHPGGRRRQRRADGGQRPGPGHPHRPLAGAHHGPPGAGRDHHADERGRRRGFDRRRRRARGD